MRHSFMVTVGILMYSCLFAQSTDVLTDIMNNHLENYFVVNQKEINSGALEFSPAIWKDSLVFVANGRKIRGRSAVEGKKLFRIFKASISEDGTLKDDGQFSDLYSEYNEGPLCFNHSGDKVYFTRNIKVVDEHDKTRLNLNIFYSERIDGQWSEPIALFVPGAGVNYCHPAISPDGMHLYFSSNRQGGYGNYDLYRVDNVDVVGQNLSISALKSIPLPMNYFQPCFPGTSSRSAPIGPAVPVASTFIWQKYSGRHLLKSHASLLPSIVKVMI